MITHVKSVVVIFILIPLECHAIEFGFYSSYGSYLSMPDVGSSLHIIQASQKLSQQEIDKVSYLSESRSTKIIFRTPVFRNSSGKKFKAHEKIPEDTEKKSIEYIISRFENIPTSTITLDEENVPWDGRKEALENIYGEVKKKYQKMNVYQWYSGSKNNNAPGNDQWPVLEADGWVFDQYTQSPKVYQEFVNSMKQLDKPMTSVLWLSPGWNPNFRERTLDFEYWDNHGFNDFKEKLKINILNSIPTVFFTYFLDEHLNPVVWWNFEKLDYERYDCFNKWYWSELYPILVSLNADMNVDYLKPPECSAVKNTHIVQ